MMEIVLHGNIEEHSDVTVRDSVEHLSPALGRPHEAGQAELSELMTRCRLRGLNQFGEIADADLARFEQGVHDPESIGIAEKSESSRQCLGVVGIEEGDRARIDTGMIMGFFRHTATVPRSTSEYKLICSGVRNPTEVSIQEVLRGPVRRDVSLMLESER